MGQPAGLLLAHRGLAFAAGPPVVKQVPLVGIQVLLQAEGHRLVTRAQLLLAPVHLVGCGGRRWGLSVCPFPRQSPGWT